MDHVDLLLLHWPGPPPGGRPNRPNNLTPAQHVAKRLAMWRALEQIYAAGKAKAIGVSNYTIAHLEALLPHCTVRPMVNQIECHLRSAQRPLVEFCQENHRTHRVLAAQGRRPGRPCARRHCSVA